MKGNEKKMKKKWKEMKHNWKEMNQKWKEMKHNWKEMNQKWKEMKHNWKEMKQKWKEMQRVEAAPEVALYSATSVVASSAASDWPAEHTHLQEQNRKSH
jgi:predicted nuclease with TOPRIM domain